MKIMCRLELALTCGVLLMQPVSIPAAENEVTVRLPAMVSRSGGAVRATVRIPRDADNRLLRVTLDSGAFYRSSEVPLEGNRAPQTHMLAWHALPPGTYEVTIQVVGTARVKQVVRRQLHVVGLE